MLGIVLVSFQTFRSRTVKSFNQFKVVILPALSALLLMSRVCLFVLLALHLDPVLNKQLFLMLFEGIYKNLGEWSVLLIRR